jgi:hypothetical protein
LAVAVARASLYVAVLSPGSPYSILDLDLDSGAVKRNVSLGKSQDISALYASDSALFALYQDSSDKTYCVTVVDLSSFTVVNTVRLPYPLRVYGVDAAGTMVLTSVFGSHELVWLSAKDGSRVKVVDGGLSNMRVVGAAVNQQSMDIVVTDATSSSLLIIAANNTVRSSIPLPSAQLGPLSVDPASSSVYSIYPTYRSIHADIRFHLTQHSLATSRPVNETVVTGAAQRLAVLLISLSRLSTLVMDLCIC